MKSLNVAVLSLLLLFAGAAANGRPTTGDPAAPVKTETGKDLLPQKPTYYPLSAEDGTPCRISPVNLRYPKEGGRRNGRQGLSSA